MTDKETISEQQSAISIQKDMSKQLSSMVAGLKEVEHIHARNTKRLDALDEMQIDKIADDVS